MNIIKKTTTLYESILLHKRLQHLRLYFPCTAKCFDTKLGKRKIECCNIGDSIHLYYYDFDDSVLFEIHSSLFAHDIKTSKKHLDNISVFLAIYEIERLLKISTSNIEMFKLLEISGKYRTY
jgi:hypothetical protein